MKPTKVLSILTVIAMVAACSKQEAAISETKQTVSDVTAAPSTQEVAISYRCDVSGKKNQPVSAHYTFKQNQPVATTVAINQKVVGKDLNLDLTYQDGMKFIAGAQVWSIDRRFDAQTVGEAVPVMFTASDQILARNCKIAK